MTSSDKAVVIICVSFLVIIMASATVMQLGDDSRAKERDRIEYCAMTARYEADAARGIAEENRRGWAAYKGREMCK